MSKIFFIILVFIVVVVLWSLSRETATKTFNERNKCWNRSIENWKAYDCLK